MSDARPEVIAQAARVVRSVLPVLPRRVHMLCELADAEAAEKRGHFLPDEDERIRNVLVRYLNVRGALLEVVESIEPFVDLSFVHEHDSPNEGQWEEGMKAFVVGFCAAALLVRSATFMVRMARDRPVVWKKLDEAEPRYGIPAKSYTRIYKNLSSTRRMWRFHEAMAFYEVHKQDLMSMADDPDVGALILALQEEEGFFERRKRSYLRRKLRYRLHSFKRRHVSGYKKVMFHLLKLSGSAIAEMKQPFAKGRGQGKRVTGDVIDRLRPNLRAGDIFITRHDDAMSNLFLPGFWPHAALYIGEQEERDDLGVALAESDDRSLCHFQFLEAKKDGVLFRPIHETLQVDAFMVLRPRLELSQLSDVLNRALTHEGKLYDFVFDFRHADRLACTEVVYRSYHGVGPVSFKLGRHGGRDCLSAEDLIEQALASGHFEKVAEFGVDQDMLWMA